jgi:hypothetical protein
LALYPRNAGRHIVSDIEIERIEPADEEVREEWGRVTEEPDVLGVGAVRMENADWPWQVYVSVMEFVRDEPLQSDLEVAVSTALAAVPGVREAAHEDRETWIIKGEVDGPSLVRAASLVVDGFAPRTRRVFDEFEGEE